MVSHYDTEMTRLSLSRSIREKLYARNPKIPMIITESLVTGRRLRQEYLKDSNYITDTFFISLD